MKYKKQYPFYQIRKKRLSLVMNNISCHLVPSYQKFFKWIFETMSQEYSYASIGLLLCDFSHAKYYNKHYRDKNYATNVLSFPLTYESELNYLRGDLIICPDVVMKEAKDQGKILEAHYAHLTVHGVLHLMGYDHMQEQEAEVMENEEINILYSMGYENPY